MPRKPAHPPVTRINPGTIREAFRRPAGSDAGYYILEKGRTLVCLRVRQSSVKIGVRHHSRWYSVAAVHAEMSIEEVEAFRLAALHLARELQDAEGLVPSPLTRGRLMTLERLQKEYLTDLRETKGEILRETTLKTYEDIWQRYLLPAVGRLTLPQVTVEVVRQIKKDIPVQAVAQRPRIKAGGRLTANLALQQLSSGLCGSDGMGLAKRRLRPARAALREAPERGVSRRRGLSSCR
jgi:hypothetical protein